MTRAAAGTLGRLPPLSLHSWLSAWWSTVSGLPVCAGGRTRADVVLLNHLSPLVMLGRTSRRTPIVLNVDDAATDDHHGRALPGLRRAVCPCRAAQGPGLPGGVSACGTSWRGPSWLARRWSRATGSIRRVTVIPNGIDLSTWYALRRSGRRAGDGAVRRCRFRTQRGRELLRVAAMPAMAGVQFHIVTKSEVGATLANVVVHRDLDAGSAGLRAVSRTRDLRPADACGLLPERVV